MFVLEAPSGQTLSLADLVADFEVGTDHLQLSGEILPPDRPGNRGTNGAAGLDTSIVHGTSGAILAHLANTEAAQITWASFL